MQISLKNISKIKEADIKINGITIIAGENNTGKSSVGKALWAIFNSFYNIDKELENERENLIDFKLANYFKENAEISTQTFWALKYTLTKKLILESNKTLENIREIIFNEIKNLENIKNESVNEIVTEIYEILSLDENFILKIHFQDILLSEFNGQVNNLYNQDEGIIEINIGKQTIKATCKAQKVEDIKNNSKNEKLNLSTKAIYIDDPYVLDNLSSLNFERNTHKRDLKSLLIEKKEKSIIENALMEKQLEKINQKLEEIFKGELIFNFNEKKVKLKNSHEDMDMRNLSTGVKTFAILKNLIINGALEKKGTIILDEPEIHLHPEWQLIFAEIIVLLQKELDLHILLATHSPYFLRAIQVYASKYEVANKCKYYLAENFENSSTIKDVSEEIELIFQKLAKPLQKLEDLTYE